MVESLLVVAHRLSNELISEDVQLTVGGYILLVFWVCYSLSRNSWYVQAFWHGKPRAAESQQKERELLL